MARTADQGIDRVGLGVVVENGEQTLKTLREIRQEMQAIASLGGPGSNVSDNIDQQNRRRRNEETKAQRERSQANKRYTEEEINLAAKAKATKMAYDAEVNRRAKVLFEQGEKERTRILKEQLAERERLVNASNERVRRKAEDPNILNRASTIEKERRAFRAARNDPARGPADNKFRSEIAEDVRALRLARRQRASEVRSLVQEMARDEAIINRDLGPERRVFRRARNDPARDQQTNQWRDDLARQLRAQRLYRDIQKRQMAQMAEEHIRDFRRVEEIQQANLARASRIRSIADDPNILFREKSLERQRRAFRAARNDPARGPIDDRFRQQLSEEIKGLRLAQRTRAAEVRNLVQEMSRDEALISRDLTPERRRFRQFRNDPARDTQTDIWRQDLARQLRAQRVARDEATKLRRQQEAEQARADRATRIRTLSEDPTILSREASLQQQRRAFRAARNDPARGELDNQFRDELAIELQALRMAQRRREVVKERADVEEEIDMEAIKAERRARDAKRREQQAIKDQLDAIQARQLISGIEEGKLRTQAERNAAKQAARARLEQNQQASHVRDFQRLETERRDLLGTFGPRGTGTGTGGGGTPPRRRGPSGPGGGGPPTPPPELISPPKNLFNERGFFTTFDAVGRITRNILLYEFVSNLSYGLVNMGQNAIQAAKDTVEYGNALRFATEQAGASLEANNQLVESLRPLGLSRQQGRQAVTEATRFAEEQPDKIDDLTRVVADIAAQRGGGITQTDELIEQLRRRESKFYKRIFGTTVESIYEQYALNQIQANPFLETGELVPKDTTQPIGPRTNLLTTREQVKQFVANMTDAQKEAAVLNYTIAQAPRFMGEAEKRATTLAGRLDKMGASMLNATEGLGLFITDLKITNDLIAFLTEGLGGLDDLRGPEIKRSGPGGYVTQADLDEYAKEMTTGPRAKTLATVNSLTDPNLLFAGAGVLGMALYGRKTATSQVRTQAFTDAYPEALARFNGNAAAAQAEAARIAGQERTTFVRAVTTGFQRVTVGMTQGILGMTEAAAQAVGAQGVAARASIANARLTNPLAGLATPNTSTVMGTPYVRPQGPYSLINPTLQASGPYTPYNPRYIGVQPFGPRPTLGPLPVTNAAGPYSVYPRPVEQFRTTQPIRSYTMSPFGPDEQAKIDAKMAGIQTGFSTAGGIAGSIAGFTIASVIAEKMQLGTITATGLTILGGIAGNAAGTAGGSLLGQAAATYGGAKLASLGGAGAIGGTVLAGLAIGGLSGYGWTKWMEKVPGSPLYEQAQGEKALAEIMATQGEWTKAQQQRKKAIDEGRLMFRLNDDVGGIDMAGFRFNRETNEMEKTIIRRFSGEIFTPAQVKELADSMGISVGEAIKKFTEVEQAPDVYTRLKNEETAELNRVDEELRGAPQSTIDSAKFRIREKYDQQRYNLLPYAEQLDKIVAADQEKRLKDYQQYVNDLSVGLSRLRDFQQGSWQIVGNVAGRLQPDNPYVQPLADLATVQERMRQQWGSLGDATVQYFTKLETRAIRLQLVKLQFESLTRSVQLFNQAGKEIDEYLSPGPNTRQTLIANAMQRQFQQIGPEMDIQRMERRFTAYQNPLFARNIERNRPWFQMQDVLSQLDLMTQAFNRASSVRGGDLGMLRGAYGQQVTSLISGLPEELLNTQLIYGSYARTGPTFGQTLASRFGQAARFQREQANREIEDEYKKIELQGREQVRVNEALKAGDRQRAQMRAEGLPEDYITSQLDKYIISATDNIPIKDLTFEQFSQRNEALKRQAREEIDRQNMAQDAVEAGLAIQSSILAEISAIRTAILTGDISLLIQVQNDTQARIDETNMKNASGPGYNVPRDRGKLNTNPYSTGTKRNPMSKYGGM